MTATSPQKRQIRWIFNCGCSAVGGWVWPHDPVLNVSVGPCDKHGGGIKIVGYEYL